MNDARGNRIPFASSALALVPALVLAGCIAAPAADGWIELFDGRSLAGLRSSEFGGDGEIQVVDGELRLGIGSPLTGVTFSGEPPHGDYELEITAARLLGSDFFCGLTFPVGTACLTLVLGGWGGAVCGLSSIDGEDADSNATRCLRHFEEGRFYTARVVVSADTVTATLDGEPLLTAEIAGHDLGLRPEVELSRPLGVASFTTQAAIRSLRWRPLTPR